MELIDDARSVVSETASTAADFAQQSADVLMKAFDTHGSGVAHSVPKPRGKKSTLLPLTALLVTIALFLGWRARRSHSDDHAKGS